MDYVAGKDQPIIRDQQPKQYNPYHCGNERARQQQQYVMIFDKRSRSETPNKMSATEVLYRAHQKLQTRRKESPSKLLEKHQQRQKKAEEVRTQIENSKKKWYEKIRVRQEIAKKKWKELLAERKRLLNEKLEQAEERRESEIELLRNKAKQEIQKIDETNYIVKMTMNNMKLDMTMKMSDFVERRNQILEEKKLKHHDRHLKEEAAEKRRQELIREQETKISRMRQKREQAELRRNQMLEQRKRAAQEYQKRIRVLQRKNDLDKISDVMSFVNNSEFIWEFLGNEEDWQDLGMAEQDDMIYELISKDQLEIQKYKLKRDAELLNRIIDIDESGNIFARKEYLPLIHKMNRRRKKHNYMHGLMSGYADLTSSSSSDDGDYYTGVNQGKTNQGQFDYEEIQDGFSPVNKHETPKKIKPNKDCTNEECKGSDCLSENSADKDSVADESVLRGQSEEKQKGFRVSQDLSEGFGNQHPNNILTDDAQNYNLYQIRIKMSMKRNILKKCLSEDLTWADFLKNDNHQIPIGPNGFPNFVNTQVRSLYSTPERKVDLINDDHDEKEEEPNTLAESVNQSIASAHSKENQKQLHRKHGKKGSSRSSGKHHHSTQNSFSGKDLSGVASSLPQISQGSSNISEKQSRISSIVYPSGKKKIPKNEKMLMSSTAMIPSSIDQSIQSQSFTLAAYRNKHNSLVGSNTSSTHSLHQMHSQNILDTSRGGQGGDSGSILVGGGNILTGTLNLGQQRKSFLLENDSGKKKQCNTARLSSTGGSQDLAGITPLNIYNAQLGNSNVNTMTTPMMELDEKECFEQQQNASLSHTGTQMSSLITNSKPLLPLNKMLPKKLTMNALKVLYPLPQQKLLLKRPGKDGQFGKFKINLKIDELLASKVQPTINLNSSQPLPQSILQSISNQNQEKLGEASSEQINSGSLKGSMVETAKKSGEDVNIEVDMNIIADKDSKSSASTPVQHGRKESADLTTVTLPIENNAQIQPSTQGTPPTQTSKLLQIQQKFLEKLQNNQSQQQTAQAVNMTGQFNEQTSNLQKKKQALIANQLHQSDTSLPISQQNLIDSTPSPKKDSSQLKQPSKFQPESEATIVPPSIIQETPQSQSVIVVTPVSNTQNLNEQGFKELLVRFLLVDNIHQIKIEDNQKTIFLEGGDEANKLIDFLEINEIQIRYCRLCEQIISESQTNEVHIQCKSHKKIRDELLIKDFEDMQLSVINIQSQPGDIEKELIKEKEKALKRKVKRIKAQMIAQSVNHETAASCPGKEFTSTIKKRCQILCLELEKQVIPIIKDYDALENSLKEIIKILDMRKQADLHLMRRLKFIPILIEICKRISVCHKNEFKHLGKVLEFVIKIINVFCGQRENRNYMLQTNRMSALIELLNWCLNRPTQLFYGINFVPQLFHILTLHVKHRAPFECQQMKELFIEYLISSQITMKIKTKFQIINGPLDLSEMMGQVPMFLLKSATFLEALTALLSIDAVNRPVYEKSDKIGEHVLFVTQNTELFGVPQMIATILLTRNQPFKPSQSSQSGKILPQTILSLAITSIKIINNVFRMDYRFAQQILSDFEIQEQLYHLINYILVYSVEHCDKQEDSKELLHETILLIGYYCLNNEKHQALLCKGESTIIQKLCALPIAYFHDKKLKEILFPTLIQASYKNERSLAIMDQEISIEMLISFIQTNIKEELPKIIEEENDYQSMSSMSHSNAMERRSHRSPSISSTNSSQQSLQIDMMSGNSPYVPLLMRFPKKLWKDAIQFYNSVLY